MNLHALSPEPPVSAPLSEGTRVDSPAVDFFTITDRTTVDFFTITDWNGYVLFAGSPQAVRARSGDTLTYRWDTSGIYILE